MLCDSDAYIEIIDSNITGNINVEASNVKVKLINSTYTGNIDNIELELDSNSKLILNKDTTLKGLKNEVEDNSNIEYNDFELITK